MMMMMMSQNQDNYLQKIKNLSGIVALIVGVGTFLINYIIAVKTYPHTPIWATRLLYYGCFIALSLTFLGLTIQAKTRIKQLIFYGGSNFYMFLVITYFLNQTFDILISQNKIIATLILTILSCIVYYLIRNLRS